MKKSWRWAPLTKKGMVKPWMSTTFQPEKSPTCAAWSTGGTRESLRKNSRSMVYGGISWDIHIGFMDVFHGIYGGLLGIHDIHASFPWIFWWFHGIKFPPTKSLTLRKRSFQEESRSSNPQLIARNKLPTLDGKRFGRSKHWIHFWM